MASGETNLRVLMASMDPVLDPETYVFATADAVPGGFTPLMTFAEAEGITMILPKRDVPDEVTWDFPCCRITLNIHSALEAVGFLAKITPALAAHGMGVNPVSAYFHDHIFVPEDRAEDAMRVLRELIEDARTPE